MAALQTEALLDLGSDEWVIHTPDDGAIKWWIGEGMRLAFVLFTARRTQLPYLQCSLTYGLGWLDSHSPSTHYHLCSPVLVQSTL